MTDSPPARAWRVVLDRIEGDLLEGTLGPGDRLPPERELATTLGVVEGGRVGGFTVRAGVTVNLAERQATAAPAG